MNSSPDISICIPNYNGADYIRDCLSSVYTQRGAFTFEVLLHDDASTDDTLDIVRREYPTVQIIASDRNVGFCISNNRMAAEAKGEYLLLLNNDAVLRPGSINVFLQFARDKHEHAILGLPQYALHDGHLVDRGYEFDIFMNPIPVFDAGIHEVATATGACLWIPRVVWDDVGGFPDWFGSVAEDIYFCQAARLLGFPTFILEAPGFDHWIGKNLGGGKVVAKKLQTTVRRRALSERNKTAIILMCYPLCALVIILPIHALLLAIEAIVLKATTSRQVKIGHIYKQILPFLWKHRREIFSFRRRLSDHKKISSWQFIKRFRQIPHKLMMVIRHGLPHIR